VSLFQPGDPGRPRADIRVLHVIQELAPGGAERTLLTVLEGGRDRGFQSAVAAAPGHLAEGLERPPFPLPLLRRRAWKVPLATRGISRAIRVWRPDVVHAYNPGMAIATSLATRRGTSPPAFVAVHGIPDEDYPRAARLLRWARLPVLACGPGVAAGLEEAGCSVVDTIVNGVSPPPPPADRAGLMAASDLPLDAALLVCVGRLAPAKNQTLAIRALSEVPHAVLLLVGDGPDRPRLEREASRTGLERRVAFAGHRDDARQIIGAADAVVVPSRSEGLPNVVLEALAAGRPVVATAIRGIRELVTDGRDGLLVPPGDPRVMGEAVRMVLADPSLAARLGQAGRELAARYPVDVMIRRYLELYQRLAA
jgi:glycosyltransferase involved in cell wall biosynthesis